MNLRVMIVDYGSGNLRSAYSSLNHALRETGLGGEVKLTQSTKDIRDATHIVLPGVGAYGDCMAGLEASCLIEDLEEAVLSQGKAFLGICVGMQLLSDWGEEGGKIKGLGWIGGVTKALNLGNGFKIPHMGWNDVCGMKPHPLWQDIDEGSHFYFVHSYHVACDETLRLGTMDYGGLWTAAIGRDNLFATQFHPEKSQRAGLQLLMNFLHWQP